MRTLAFLLAATALAAAFSGCTGSSDSDSGDKSILPGDRELPEATKETGILVGVVVNEAIVPIADVTVTATGPDGNSTTATTDAEGVFAFGDLQPGAYLVSAAKLGYHDGQATQVVEAGVSDPEAIRITLRVDLATAPFPQLTVFDGYIECSITTPALALAVCDVPNLVQEGLTDDRFVTFVPVDRVPMWVQHELVWDATQNTGNMFNLAARTATQSQHDNGTYETRFSSTIGTSPLLAVANASVIKEYKIGQNETGLAPAVFAGGMEGSEVCSPVDLPAVPNPVTGGNVTRGGPFCTFGTGATLQQKFQLYTTVFYGYLPPEGWLFSETNELPPPPQ